MKKQQLRSLLILSVCFFGVFVNCDGVDQKPANVDIYTSTFFSLDPPFICPSESQEKTTSALFSFDSESRTELIEGFFKPGSPLYHMSGHDVSNIIKEAARDAADAAGSWFRSKFLAVKDYFHHLGDPKTENPKTENPKTEKRMKADHLIHFGAKMMFTNYTNPSSHILNVSSGADGHSQTEQDKDPKKVGDSFSGHHFSPTLNVTKFEGFYSIILCIMKSLAETREHPQNIGSITCRCANSGPSTTGTCQFLSYLSTTIACSKMLTCPLEDPKPYVPPEDKLWTSLPMVATIPTPNEIPRNIVDQEIHTYDLAFKSLTMLSYDAGRVSCDPSFNDFSNINGWNILITANLVEAKSPLADRVPFARLSTRPNQQNPKLVDFLISVRGTMTSREWGIDFSYSQIFGKLTQFDSIPVHRGFAALSSAVWQTFQLELQKASDSGTLGLITTTGHSLGGGVAGVLASLVSKQFPAYLPNSKTPRIRTILFGSPRSGGAQLRSDLANVVVRTLESVWDPIPQLPCTSMPGCPASLVPVPTARDETARFTYASTPGLVNVTLSDVPSDFYEGPAANTRVRAWHNCAYDCFTSKGSDPNNPASCYSPRVSGRVTDPRSLCNDLPTRD